jgi:hypothetical protein
MSAWIIYAVQAVFFLLTIACAGAHGLMSGRDNDDEQRARMLGVCAMIFFALMTALMEFAK